MAPGKSDAQGSRMKYDNRVLKFSASGVEGYLADDPTTPGSFIDLRDLAQIGPRFLWKVRLPWCKGEDAARTRAARYAELVVEISWKIAFLFWKKLCESVFGREQCQRRLKQTLASSSRRQTSVSSSFPATKSANCAMNAALPRRSFCRLVVLPSFLASVFSCLVTRQQRSRSCTLSHTLVTSSCR